jgi:hypothetical protein
MDAVSKQLQKKIFRKGGGVFTRGTPPSTSDVYSVFRRKEHDGPSTECSLSSAVGCNENQCGWWSELTATDSCQ